MPHGGPPSSSCGGRLTFFSLVPILRIVTVAKIRIQCMPGVRAGSHSGEGVREVRNGAPPTSRTEGGGTEAGPYACRVELSFDRPLPTLHSGLLVVITPIPVNPRPRSHLHRFFPGHRLPR